MLSVFSLDEHEADENIVIGRHTENLPTDQYIELVRANSGSSLHLPPNVFLRMLTSKKNADGFILKRAIFKDFIISNHYPNNFALVAQHECDKKGMVAVVTDFDLSAEGKCQFVRGHIFSDVETFFDDPVSSAMIHWFRVTQVYKNRAYRWPINSILGKFYVLKYNLDYDPSYNILDPQNVWSVHLMRHCW